jgi:hypothetical protein
MACPFASLDTFLCQPALRTCVVGACAIRVLAVKRGRIERLNIEELEVGRLHVRELVVEQEQTPRQGASAQPS